MAKHKGLDTIKIYELNNKGMSINQLARRFEVSPTTILYHINKAKLIIKEASDGGQEEQS